MHEGFTDLRRLIPDLAVDIRYAGCHNLTGHPLNGYDAPRALMTVEAAAALRKAAERLRALGYGLLVYDAYRPCRAVRSFVDWSHLPEDGLTKAEFYPELEKERLFDLGYIAERSGHSRGSTVDLTLTVDGVPVDMGTAFDRMSVLSHHNAPGFSDEVNANRALLRAEMCRAGFAPYACEWWHYTLMDEPYPDTYFDFPITAD